MGGDLNRNPLMSRNQNFLNTDGDKKVYNLLCIIQDMNKTNTNKENVNYSNGRSYNNNSKSTRFSKNTVSFS